MIRSALLRRLVLPALILAWACALRVVLFSGFVLCDDREEFWTAVHMLVHGPAPPHHLQLRFGAWLFNVGAFKLFGISEFSFFVPTALMSASLSVVGYAILLRWGYALLPAFAAALMIAAAPFEILMGTVRANDMILAWLVGLAVAALVVLDERPVRQGLAVALLGWLGFYVKLWVVYFLPALGIHYLVEAWRRGRCRGGVVFALLLEFFPNSFTFDRYYSAPRIFRYPAPLSFPMTLHLAKMVLDLVPARAGWLPVAGLLALTGLNLHQAAEATAPSRAYRATLMAVLREVRARRPPMLVTEGWLSYFLSNAYLNDLAWEVQVVQIPQIYAARDYEAWLQRRQPDFAPGTFLLTGFGSCVHYGAIGDGFRLALFQDGLHPAWKVLNDYGPLAYHPSPEPVRLWELTEPIARTHPPPADGVERSRGPEQLFKTGMARFDEGKPAEAAPYFHTVATDFPDSAFAEDAEYFYAICLFREGRWWETIVGFEEIVRRRPAGRRVPAAYYHIGLSYAALGDQDRAREAFETLRRRFPREETLGRYAAEQLAMLDAQAGWFERLRKRLGIRR